MSSGIQTWSSNGKLLITGEYLVMEGALSFALPLKVGQSLSVNPNNTQVLKWQANYSGSSWFLAEYNLKSFNVTSTDNEGLAQKLKDILISVRKLAPSFISGDVGYDVVTDLDFNPEFGFGTSSTLIYNIASWANIDPYELLNITFGGSGYDIACARAYNPITYQLKDNSIEVNDIDFNPLFKDKLFFVYLGKKQSSKDGIEAFKKHNSYTLADIATISGITKKMVAANDFSVFQNLMENHEKIMSKILGLPTVKSLYFPDLMGAVKSLGAWGGDFVMIATTEPEDKLKNYLQKKGFDIVFGYDELVL